MNYIKQIISILALMTSFPGQGTELPSAFTCRASLHQASPAYYRYFVHVNMDTIGPDELPHTVMTIYYNDGRSRPSTKHIDLDAKCFQGSLCLQGTTETGQSIKVIFYALDTLKGWVKHSSFPEVEMNCKVPA